MYLFLALGSERDIISKLPGSQFSGWSTPVSSLLKESGVTGIIAVLVVFAAFEYAQHVGIPFSANAAGGYAASQRAIGRTVEGRRSGMGGVRSVIGLGSGPPRTEARRRNCGDATLVG